MKHIVFEFVDYDKAEAFGQEVQTLERQDEFRRCGSMSFYISIPNEASEDEAQTEVDEFLYQLGYVQGKDYNF